MIQILNCKQFMYGIEKIKNSIRSELPKITMLSKNVV